MVEKVQRDSSFDDLSICAYGGGSLAVDGRGLPSKHQVQEASELCGGFAVSISVLLKRGCGLAMAMRSIERLLFNESFANLLRHGSWRVSLH